MNKFLKAATSHNDRTWNQAISHSTTGSTLIDYFGKCGSYRGRTQEEVNADISSIFADDAWNALKTVFYNRMITRKIRGSNGYQTEHVNRGQGNRDEFIKSLIWLSQNRPEILEQNLHLVPLIGTYKDLFYDSAKTGVNFYPNRDTVYEIIKVAMLDDNQRQLVAKYLPRIRSSKNVRTERHRRQNAFAKGLCRYLGWTLEEYRKFKSAPNNKAHDFQRKMCAKKWSELNFKTIPGKALFNLVKGEILKKHGLEKKYAEWIKSQPVAKFTGYPYELYKEAKVRKSLVQKYTYDKQFDGLIELAKEGVSSEILKRGVLCALDTSGSMAGNYNCNGLPDGLAPIDICVGLGIYFSKLLQGHFADHVIMFDDNSKFLKLKGDFCDRVDQITKHSTAWGGTSFESIIDEIVRVRKKNPNIPISDFPEILLVVSDMQFNPVGNNTKTNYEAAMKKLKLVGLPPITIIWWQVNGRFTSDFPNKFDDPGTVLISGFDGSIVTSILGAKDVVDEKTGEKRKPTPEEQMYNVLNQEILNQLVI